jgi:hypothetical protein
MIARRAAVLAAATLALAWTPAHGRPACRGHSLSARLCSVHERFHQ